MSLTVLITSMIHYHYEACILLFAVNTTVLWKLCRGRSLTGWQTSNNSSLLWWRASLLSSTLQHIQLICILTITGWSFIFSLVLYVTSSTWNYSRALAGLYCQFVKLVHFRKMSTFVQTTEDYSTQKCHICILLESRPLVPHSSPLRYISLPPG